jgi:formylglycine-generating enzyme required for sulfatase activity
MRKFLAVGLCVFFISNVVSADTFGSVANQFDIDFVNISSATNPTSGYGIVNNDYRMGTYEITNGQWNKFTDIYGTPTGSPSNAYDESAHFTGTNVPTNEVSWYEAAQFVNWLNTSTGHQAAYKFTGTQGQSNYTLDIWSSTEAYGGTNLYRHKDAFYFLPTEDEWVKAAYWNGTSLQTYATIDNSIPVTGVDTNYYNVVGQPWDVGDGTEELNGTFDMMGNVQEWMENPYNSGSYSSGSSRCRRGGTFVSNDYNLSSSSRHDYDPDYDAGSIGFRVASVPEPCSLVLLSLGGLALIKRKR